MAELVFHAVVRSIRSKHSNAVVSLLMNILQVLVMVAAFYLMLSLMGARVAKLRGDFFLFLLSGVFLFQCHIKTVSAIAGVGTGNNPMMLHSPMNMMVTLLAAGLSTLYTQVMSIMIILFLYHVAVTPVVIEDPAGASAMMFLAWFTGGGVGLVFLAIKPWFPTFATILNTVYRRMNMVFSGKMFVANALPPFMLVMFDWNPLFHIIDQCRGFVFRNYFPRVTSWEYAVWVGIVLLMIGLMAEFYTRRQVSQSWFARR
ncbi:ABC transporter permease [Ruegeria sediminis]|uniref:ABC transporter permease n=2 Tax=Ruegeria sediminis TaxID=2583820 RepID=A0ABY2WWZ2_9RHOB|nr:ABC transporter permease [Ruegeria sediminis]